MNDETEYGLVAVKRKWVPEWLFAIFAWPFDLIIHQPFRWVFTTPVKQKKAKSFKELFADARKNIHYYTMGLYLAENEEQFNAAEKALLDFIEGHYDRKDLTGSLGIDRTQSEENVSTNAEEPV